MRRVVRVPWVKTAAAWLLAAYVNLALATMRWRYENRGPADTFVRSPQGAVALFWHSRIALAVTCRTVLKDKPRRVMISRSHDGDMVALAVERLGFPAIRGSSGSKDILKAVRGAAAFRDSLKFLRQGGVVAITPDGPRGPPEIMPSGPVQIARAAEAPVFLFGLASRPVITVNSWDKTRIPLPFSRGCVVFDGPLWIAPDADEAAIEAPRADWETRLTAAQDQAEAILART